MRNFVNNSRRLSENRDRNENMADSGRFFTYLRRILDIFNENEGEI
jgi:hypothetical protein